MPLQTLKNRPAPELQQSPLKVRRVDMLFISALLLLSSMLILSYQIKDQLINSNRWTSHTYQVIAALDQLRETLLETESCRRGYLLTRGEEQKQQCLFYAQSIPNLLAQVKQLTSDNDIQQQRYRTVAALIDQKLVNTRRALLSTASTAAAPSERAEEGSALMSLIGARIDEMKNDEQHLLKGRRSAEQITMQYLIMIVWAGILAAMTILTATYFITRREAIKHELAAGALEASNKDMINLSDMNEFLQSCSSLEEAREIVARYGAKFFPVDPGAVYLFDDSRTSLVQAAAWGEPSCRALFPPDQCWALRLGQSHVMANSSEARCSHIDSSARASVCILLAAQHETIGLCHIAFTSALGGADLKNKQQLAVAFADQVALALGNLQLREQLRELSIRDPLTGLLNRRYMEESLSREIARGSRNNLPVSVIMMDIDHFKRVNDTFGHEAGDRVLKEFGKLLLDRVRGSDIACRFGGEEFTVILPEACRDTATFKANSIREEVKGARLVVGRQSLGVVTVSAGIAVFPEDGESAQQLMAAADAALYRAKGGGRDRVESLVPQEKLRG